MLKVNAAPAPYSALESLTAELRLLADANDWDAVAARVSTIRLEGLPKARPEDRAAIESALANIAAITERAVPLRQDIAKMLSAFGMPTPAP
ncbi:MAG TPA: hypothetical protein VJ576_06700 [Rhodocyclaceae bacterium]|nr:hypothetical protein [Rhodocyclaceae bacterium]